MDNTSYGYNRQTQRYADGVLMRFYMEDDEHRRLLTDITTDVKTRIELNLAALDINYTGTLSKSFQTNVTPLGGEIYTKNPYAGFVEFGSPRGEYVPFEKLLRWVKVKLGIANEKKANDVTWKIRNKIHQSGIEETRFFRKAVKKFTKLQRAHARKTKVEMSLGSHMERIFA